MFDQDSDDASRLPLAESGVDRDVKIEQLLLAGPDHYFNAQYEQALDVWTRVLFLDRGDARARAYIERARAALGERQREADELVHTGVAAFNRGDVGEARELLTSALERGGQHDEALVLLDRLSRLEASGGSADEQVAGCLAIRRRRGAAAPRVGRAPARAVSIWPRSSCCSASWQAASMGRGTDWKLSCARIASSLGALSSPAGRSHCRYRPLRSRRCLVPGRSLRRGNCEKPCEPSTA